MESLEAAKQWQKEGDSKKSQDEENDPYFSATDFLIRYNRGAVHLHYCEIHTLKIDNVIFCSQ